MSLLFFLSLGVIGYTYFGYPVLMALLARVQPHPWVRKPMPSSVSVVMAVHNGAAMLPAQIAHLLTLDARLVTEILIVSDGSTDATAALLGEARDSRIKAIVLREQVGKAAALNHGIEAAKGEILLFIDIRPRLAPDALRELVSNFADERVGCVAGELVLATKGQDAAASAVSGFYWKYEQWIRNSESTWKSPVGVYGGFYAVRRSLVRHAPAGLILDDMFQPLSILRQGYRSVVDRAAIVTDQWPAEAAGEFHRKVRTLAGNFQLIALAPWVLSPETGVLFQFVSHKLLRLVVPYFFILLLLSSALLGTQSIGWAAIAILQAAFWTGALLALRVRIPILHRVAGPASALLVLNAAAVVALYTFLFTPGPLWKIWKPTVSPASEAFVLPQTSRTRKEV